MKIRILFLILILSSSCAAEKPKIRPESWGTQIISENLKNWYKVDEKVYRSEQPDEEAMADVERFGIQRVLNLREYHDDDDETQKTNLTTFHIPMNAAKIQDEDVIKALRIIKSSNQPIIIHCWNGSDRTGTIVALYRIVEQRWSKQAAIDELVNGGYGYHFIYLNIINYINNVDVEYIRAQTNRP